MDGGWWTIEALALETGVNNSTVRTVLQRNDRAFEKRPDDRPAGHPGRRKDHHRLIAAFRPEIERRAAVQDFGDPIERSIKIVEQAAEAWRRAESDDERKQVLELAALQSNAARRLIETSKEQREPRELRLLTAQARLADLVKGEHRPQEEHAWAIAAHYSGMKAAMHRPPRAAWQRYREMLRRLIEDFAGSWDEAPAAAAAYDPGLAIVIDAITASSDPVSPRLIRALQDSGMHAARFTVRTDWDARKRDAFLKSVASLNEEPVACLAPVFLTLDSDDAVSKASLTTLATLNEGTRLQKAVRAARSAISDAVKSKDLPDVDHAAAFYGAFIANAAIHHAGNSSVWEVVRGPVIFDRSVDQGLEAKILGTNGMYVGDAGSADMNSVVAHWAQSAALPGIADPLRW
ncbi:MAG TPA: hypothetical protein VEA80_00665 [Vitreimonas sp.]|nr:hypothetical protein [Vitreimonas sp.]